MIIALNLVFLTNENMANQSVGTYALDSIKLSQSVKSKSLNLSNIAAFDESALAINAASLNSATKKSISFYHLNAFLGVSHQQIELKLPTTIGNLALLGGFINDANHIRTTMVDRNGTSSSYFNNEYQLYSFVYSNGVSVLDYGIKFNYFRQILDGRAASVKTVDIGTIYRLGEHTRVGLAFSNLELERLAIGSRRYPVEKQLSLGLAQATSIFGFKSNVMISWVHKQSHQQYLSGGLDLKVSEFINFRAGFSGENIFTKHSYGIGLNLNGVTFDFAYLPNEDLFSDVYSLGVKMDL